MGECPSSSSPPTTGSGSVGAGGPGTSAPGPAGDSCPRRPARARREPGAWRSAAALAVHYFPGMWAWDRTIVEPLGPAAYERGGRAGRTVGPLARGRSCAGRRRVDRCTPLRVEADIDVHVPDPVLARHPPGHDRTGDAGALPRPHRPGAGRRRRPVLAGRAPRGRGASPTDDELRLDERGVLACWAWERDRAGARRSPASSTPSCASTRRRSAARSVPRSDGREGAARPRRLGARGAGDARPRRRASSPTPSWAHCARCPFRAPCIAMNRGDDAEPLLATRYRRARPPDLPRGGPPRRQSSWGMGRGSPAPPFATVVRDHVG